MTDAQLIGLVIALAFTPLATLMVMVLGKNAEHKYVSAEIGRLETKVDSKLELLETRLTTRIDRMEHELITRIAGLDTRLSRLEARS